MLLTGITVFERIVHRLMKEDRLQVQCVKKRYSSYAGEIISVGPNIIDRNLHAEAPNIKWRIPTCGNTYSNIFCIDEGSIAKTWNPVDIQNDHRQSHRLYYRMHLQ